MIPIKGSSAPQDILPESIPCVQQRVWQHQITLEAQATTTRGLGTIWDQWAWDDGSMWVTLQSSSQQSQSPSLLQKMCSPNWFLPRHGERESSPVTSFLVKHYPRWTHWASDAFAVAHHALWSRKNPNTALKRQCLLMGCVRLKTWHWEGRQFFLMVPGDWLSDPPYLYCLKTECQGRCSRPSFLANELHKSTKEQWL